MFVEGVASWLVCWTSDRARDCVHCVVFFCKTLNSHSAFQVYKGLYMGTLLWTSILFRGGGVEILLVTSGYRNRDKHRLCGSDADLFFTYI